MPLSAQLAAFAAGRAELVAVLRVIEQETWSRQGIHETRGVLTLHQIVTDLAVHELEHHAQWDNVLLALGAAPPLSGRGSALPQWPRRAGARGKR
jgi:hypothetical protein